MANKSAYHIPVLLNECVDGLAIQPDGVYVDATFGGGGHAKAILEKIGENGKLFAFDQDADAAKNTLPDSRFTLIEANFKYLNRFLRLHKIKEVDGILADLGVSSHQLDTAERGFSFRFEAALDMRMNKSGEKTAKQILAQYSEEELVRIFSEFGEVRNSKSLAQAVVGMRENKAIDSTSDLKFLLEQNAIGEKHRYNAQVFQALRMEVNDELGVLKELLVEGHKALKTGGRMAVITFHSLEDRIVKNYFKNSCFEDEPEKDFFGNQERKWKLITKKPITASGSEQKINSRSGSAKLRIAEKL